MADFNATVMYHAKHGERVVRSQAELSTLGEGWCDSPKKAKAGKARPSASADPPADPSRAE